MDGANGHDDETRPRAARPHVTRPSSPGALAAQTRSLPAAFQPGSLLAGTYRIDHVLGEGGMGSVLLATDEALDRPVAIKVIRAELVAVPEVRERFFAEARTMARLRHAHVVGVHALGEVAGFPYLVMEHVPGMSLSTLRDRRGGRLGVDETIAILDQVCRGVSALHAAGVTHRDLKPDNVLIGPGFRVVVSDLGLARTFDVRSADAWFTPGYAAPEVFLDDGASRPDLAPLADVYSLGALAYALLVGELPFENDRARIAAMAQGLRPARPSEACAGLPAALDTPILAALSWYPEHRPPSVDALRRALFAAAEEGAAPLAPLRIFVIDDDPSYRDLLARVLATAFRGSTVRGFDSGADAVAASIASPPSLVVTDLDMPGMNGVELTATLRSDARTAGVPIIVASAVGGPTDWALLSRLGADAFVGKPIDAQQLAAIARTVVRGQDRRSRMPPPPA